MHVCVITDSELSRSCDTGGGVRAKPCGGRAELCSTPDGSGVISTGPNGVTTPTSEWLYSVLLPKVVQWAEECGGGEVARQQPLVPLGKYCSLYRELKEKYGPPLIKVGTPLARLVPRPLEKWPGIHCACTSFP